MLHCERHQASVRSTLAAQPRRQQSDVLLHLAQLRGQRLPTHRPLEHVEQPAEESTAQPVSRQPIEDQTVLLVAGPARQIGHLDHRLDLLGEGL